MSVEEHFNVAVKVIQQLPQKGPYQPNKETQLMFYSLYKQATKGRCPERQPPFWDLIGRTKWNAWNRLADMPKEEAMQRYVDALEKILLNNGSELVPSFVKCDIAVNRDSIQARQR
ncbi:acyl-CoA-binding domain-containing protein 5A-like isoform X2 [Wyeomyia smithii]|uniref:acyl-CoA-binding domain-containing protein 5A-like isoform X2 n=1 Tax=Wyeomyia smithii TaxID=174621 RepID=UPI0024680C18|nr:acyl-CoA-binding domain-containing protein 5A-like isoform X2 [Wyeomyia smithii]